MVLPTIVAVCAIFIFSYYTNLYVRVLRKRQLMLQELIQSHVNSLLELHEDENFDTLIIGSSTVRGLKGCTSFDLIGVDWMKASELEDALVRVRPTMRIKHTFVYIGVNDLIFDDTPLQIADHIKRVCRLIAEFSENVHYIPIIVSPFQVLRRQEERIKAINSEVARDYPSFSKIQFTLTDFKNDLLHLNHRGNTKLRKAIERHLETIIGTRDVSPDSGM